MVGWMAELALGDWRRWAMDRADAHLAVETEGNKLSRLRMHERTGNR